jgi:hypothetical protein
MVPQKPHSVVFSSEIFFVDIALLLLFCYGGLS